MTSILLTSVLLLSATPAPAAAPPSPATHEVVRKGFSLELGIGYGAIWVSGLDRYGGEKQDRGFEPHAISLGGFLTNNLALFFRWKSTYHGTNNARGKTSQRFLGTQTANLQWWFHDRAFLGGGVGLALFGHGFGKSPDDPGWSFGAGLDARVGFALLTWRHHLVSLAYEVVAGFFRQGAALGMTVNLSYQYY